MKRPPKPWTYQVAELRVIDGDTVAAVLDLGFHCSFKVTMRLDGINAAEHGTKAGDAATAWLAGICADAKGIVVTTRKQATGDKYGRILATLFCDGVCVNDLAVSGGYALPYSGRGTKEAPDAVGD